MTELPSYTRYQKYLDDTRRVFPAWVSPQGKWLTCSKGKGYDLHEFHAMSISGVTGGDVDDKIEALKFMFSNGYARVGFDHQDPSTQEVIISTGKGGLTRPQELTLLSHYVSIPIEDEWEEAREFDRAYGKERTSSRKVDAAIMGLFLPAEYAYAEEIDAERIVAYKKAVDIGAVCSK